MLRQQLAVSLAVLFLGGCAARELASPAPQEPAPTNLRESADEAKPPHGAEEDSKQATAPEEGGEELSEEEPEIREEKVHRQKELRVSDDVEPVGGDSPNAKPAPQSPAKSKGSASSPRPAGACTSIACQAACERYRDSLADACAQAFAAGCFETPRPDPKKCVVPQAVTPRGSNVATRKSESKKSPKRAEAPNDDSPSALPELFGDP